MRIWKAIGAAVFLLWPLTTFSAVWRLIPYDFSIYDIAIASEEGFVVVGHTNSGLVSEHAEDAFVLALDNDGQTRWQRALGGLDDEVARRVLQTVAGQHLIAGETEDLIFIVEIDQSGTVQWQNRYSNPFNNNGDHPDHLNDIIATDDHGYLLVGDTETSTEASGTAGRHGLVMKLDASGDILWQRRLILSGGTHNDVRRAMQTNDGGYILAGNASGDPYLVKLDANAVLQWSRYFDDTAEYTYYWDDAVRAVIQTRDGGYLLGLRADRGEYTEDMVLLKLSSEGLIEWQHFYGTVGGYNTGGKEYLADIIEQDDGYLLGLSYRAPWASSVIMKVSLQGDILFQHRPSGGKYVDRFLQAEDGGYVLAGTYIQKLDADFGYGRSGCSVYESNVRRSASEFFIDETISVRTESADLIAQSASMPVTPLALEVSRSCYEPDQVDLAVTKSGAGFVSSTPAGIACGDLCRSGFTPSSTIELEATPAFGYRFVGWEGACLGQGASCQIELSLETNVRALFEPETVFGTTWRLKYHDIYRESNEVIEDLATAFDGTFRAVGSTTASNREKDIFIMSLAADGHVLWQRAVGEDADETAYRVQETAAGTHVIAGQTFSYGDASNVNDSDRKELVLMEIDRAGTLLWQKTYGTIFAEGEVPDEVNDLILTQDAGYLLVGRSENADGERLAFAMKLSRGGVIEWQQRFALSNGYETSLTRAIQTADGGYALIGVGDLDVFLIKLSPTGDLEWSRYYDDPNEGTYQNSDNPRAIVQTADGGYLLGLAAEIDEWDYMHDGALLKLSPTGLIEWQFLYGVTGHQNWARDWPVDIIETTDRFIVGFVHAQNYRGAAILEIDKQTGTILSQTGMSVAGNPERFLSLPDGSYAFAGQYIVKLNTLFGFDCTPGQDEGCNCQTFATDFNRRVADYYIVDEITLMAEPARLQAQSRDMDSDRLELETWLSCTPPVPALTVTKTGEGDVLSDPVGIDCGETCTATFSLGTPVTLDASAHSGYHFDSWSGACTGALPRCDLLFDQALAVQANFNQGPLPSYRLQVEKQGSGRVTSRPTGIDCGQDCSETYPLRTQVTLTSTADSGATFTGWGGACSGPAADCTIVIDADRSVSAGFIENTTCDSGPRLISDVVLSGQQLHQSETTLATRARVRVLSGAEVMFEASQSITLSAGFHAEQGSAFQARILPINCR
ncbi:MAG: hypothetical protein C1943_05220 [Halochromatium sp.]|nr:hypothetical protein [Halochromatium sp.]